VRRHLGRAAARGERGLEGGVGPSRLLEMRRERGRVRRSRRGQLVGDPPVEAAPGVGRDDPVQGVADERVAEVEPAGLAGRDDQVRALELGQRRRELVLRAPEHRREQGRIERPPDDRRGVGRLAGSP
jgi:hypothetical protein